MFVWLFFFFFFFYFYYLIVIFFFFFFFQAEDGIRDLTVTGVQTCALPICALVAVEPATGGVLAFVSKPGFDPNLFVDGIDPQNWQELNTSPDRPMVNRALAGTYPPGSTFKPFMALAALALGRRTPQQAISDPGHFTFGNHVFRDDKVGGHGMVDMYKSIVVSCDTYYYVLANDLKIDAISAFMGMLGLGSRTRSEEHT